MENSNSQEQGAAMRDHYGNIGIIERPSDVKTSARAKKAYAAKQYAKTAGMQPHERLNPAFRPANLPETFQVILNRTRSMLKQFDKLQPQPAKLETYEDIKARLRAELNARSEATKDIPFVSKRQAQAAETKPAQTEAAQTQAEQTEATARDYSFATRLAIALGMKTVAAVTGGLRALAPIAADYWQWQKDMPRAARSGIKTASALTADFVVARITPIAQRLKAMAEAVPAQRQAKAPKKPWQFPVSFGWGNLLKRSAAAVTTLAFIGSTFAVFKPASVGAELTVPPAGNGGIKETKLNIPTQGGGNKTLVEKAVKDMGAQAGAAKAPATVDEDPDVVFNEPAAKTSPVPSIASIENPPAIKTADPEKEKAAQIVATIVADAKKENAKEKQVEVKAPAATAAAPVVVLKANKKVRVASEKEVAAYRELKQVAAAPLALPKTVPAFMGKLGVTDQAFRALPVATQAALDKAIAKGDRKAFYAAASKAVKEMAVQKGYGPEAIKMGGKITAYAMSNAEFSNPDVLKVTAWTSQVLRGGLFGMDKKGTFEERQRMGVVGIVTSYRTSVLTGQNIPDVTKAYIALVQESGRDPKVAKLLNNTLKGYSDQKIKFLSENKAHFGAFKNDAGKDLMAESSRPAMVKGSLAVVQAGFMKDTYSR